MTIIELLNQLWGYLSRVLLCKLPKCLHRVSCNLQLKLASWIQHLRSSSYGPGCLSNVTSYHSYPSPIHSQCGLPAIPWAYHESAHLCAFVNVISFFWNSFSSFHVWKFPKLPPRPILPSSFFFFKCLFLPHSILCALMVLASRETLGLCVSHLILWVFQGQGLWLNLFYIYNP